MADVQPSSVCLNPASRSLMARPVVAAQPPLFGRLLQSLLGGDAAMAPQDTSGLTVVSPEVTAHSSPDAVPAGASAESPGKGDNAAEATAAVPDPASMPFERASPVPLPIRPAVVSSLPRHQATQNAIAAEYGVEATATLAAGRQTLPAPLSAGILPNGEIGHAASPPPDPEQEEPGGSTHPETLLRGLPLLMVERPVSAAGREVLPLHLPVRANGWDGELGQRVVWMAGRQAQWAELTLNPPSLGSVEIRLSLHGNEAGAHFFATQPGVREAIEAALPRLREMLAEVGLSLGHTEVSAESFSGRNRGDEDGIIGGGQAEILLETTDVPHRKTVLGLVDLYV